ncbi:MAG: insulinase family protein, partial [Verrucomicrobia bacterium]|nr:insulinase family protein [Verrucomicrobiota bacterium]
VQLAGIQARRDDLLKSASLAMRRGLFGPASFGLDPIGTEASVAKVSVADLKKFHGQFTVPNNCVLAVFGDVKAAEVKAAIEKAFAGWKANAAFTQKPNFPTPKLDAPKRFKETRDKKQAVLVIGFPGTTIFNEDRYALELLQECCSDLGSRLFLRIREQLGLAYYVGAQNLCGVAPGYFAFYTGTEPAKAELVEQELLKEAELLRTEGLTAEELKRAKAKIIGQKKISRADLGHLASTSALDALYGLGYDRSAADDAKYEAVTLEQIKTVAQKYLKPESTVIAIVMPEKSE